MEHTKNYNLPQWKKDDRIMMDDFNAAMSSIEKGLTDNKASADSGIAQARAEAAALPYVVGTYTGNGSTIREITLGFRPRFLLVCTNQRTHQMSYYGVGMAMAGPNINYQRLYLTSTGFRVDGSDTVNIYPDLNTSGTTYDYIAFR